MGAGRKTTRPREVPESVWLSRVPRGAEMLPEIWPVLSARGDGGGICGGVGRRQLDPGTSTGGRQRTVMRVRAHSLSQRAVAECDGTCEAR